MSTRRHIAILCSRLDLPGGIERAVVNTANLFAENDQQVTLVILDETAAGFYPINKKIKIIQQPLSFGITKEGNVISRKIKLLSDVLKLRKILRSLQADLIICTEYPFSIAAVLAGVKKRSTLVSWEHHHYNWLEKNKFWTSLFNLAYPKLDAIVCLNKGEAAHYSKFTKTVIIPNFIESKGKASDLNSKTILSVGWLIPRKGIDMMMATAKDILQKHPGWKWKLIGDGEMKDHVLKFIAEEKLQDRFMLQAPVNTNIEEEYQHASLFVLSSRYEAFPMVLLEAMAAGVPCISFDCPSGPADIIQHNKTGLLVEKENTKKLAWAVSYLIEDDKKRKEMGMQAMESIKTFAPDKIYLMWTNIRKKQ